MGEEEEDLVILCVSAEMETEPGSRVLCGGSAGLGKYGDFKIL